MADPKMDRILIAAPEKTADKLCAILKNAGIEAGQCLHTGEETLAACAQEGALLLTTYKLEDMTGAELAGKLGEGTDVLMIIPQDDQETLPSNVLPLRNPVSQDALAQAVRTMLHCRGKAAALLKRAEKAERMLEDRKVIDRAKGRLMDALHLTEAEAHHYIQKRSMDSGRRIADVAHEVLEAETIEP